LHNVAGNLPSAEAIGEFLFATPLLNLKPENQGAGSSWL
jgi:hypothetical protein